MSKHSSALIETPPLSHAEPWTLHHVLLDRLTDETATAAGPVDHRQLREAFETLDDGGDEYTREQLRAIQSVLAAYHHSPTWWEIERPRLEGLLHRVSGALERTEPS